LAASCQIVDGRSSRSRIFRVIQLLSRRARSLGHQRQARLPTTNAKPRDDYAGPDKFATCSGLISSRHRGACWTVVTGWRYREFHRYVCSPITTSFYANRVTTSSSAPVPRLGIILRHRLEGGRCPSASGTPATRGAHNSEILVQQPDRQLLVRESLPSRIAETCSVDAYRRSLSRRSAYRIGMTAARCWLYLTQVNERALPANSGPARIKACSRSGAARSSTTGCRLRLRRLWEGNRPPRPG
jgi:hypothetical protein